MSKHDVDTVFAALADGNAYAIVRGGNMGVESEYIYAEGRRATLRDLAPGAFPSNIEVVEFDDMDMTLSRDDRKMLFASEREARLNDTYPDLRIARVGFPVWPADEWLEPVREKLELRVSGMSDDDLYDLEQDIMEDALDPEKNDCPTRVVGVFNYLQALRTDAEDED